MHASLGFLLFTQHLRVGPGHAVVDLGCGDGKICFGAAAAGAHAIGATRFLVPAVSALIRCGTGVDLDAALVSACTASAASLSHAHLLKFVVADILDFDTLAAVHDFAGQDHATVIAMY
jgi:predicted RNA methylase